MSGRQCFSRKRAKALYTACALACTQHQLKHLRLSALQEHSCKRASGVDAGVAAAGAGSAELPPSVSSRELARRSMSRRSAALHGPASLRQAAEHAQ